MVICSLLRHESVVYEPFVVRLCTAFTDKCISKSSVFITSTDKKGHQYYDLPVLRME